MRWIFLLIIIGLGSGCSTLDKLYDRDVTTETVTVPAVTRDSNPGGTLVVGIGGEDFEVPNLDPAAVGSGVQVTTPFGRVLHVSTNAPPGVADVPGAVYYSVSKTNLVAKPVIQGSLDAAGTLPLPWAGTVAGLLGMVYAGYRNTRNKKAAVSVIAGVDQLRKTLQETEEGKILDAKLKRILEDHQAAFGVADIVGTLIKNHTTKTRV